MFRKNKKAFAIIELVAVLVILAILALIVTPLVMNIIKKAQDSGTNELLVLLLKAEPLTVDKVNRYGSGYVNMHVTTNTSDQCNFSTSEGCKNDYA